MSLSSACGSKKHAESEQAASTSAIQACSDELLGLYTEVKIASDLLSMKWDDAKASDGSRVGNAGDEFITVSARQAREMLEATNKLTASASELKGRFSGVKCTNPNRENHLVNVNDIALRVYVFTCGSQDLRRHDALG